MVDLIRNGERLSSVRAKLNATLRPYASREEFETAAIPTAVTLVNVIDAGNVVQLVRDEAGDWTGLDGAKWTATILTAVAYDDILDLTNTATTAASAAEAAQAVAEAAAAAAAGAVVAETAARIAGDEALDGMISDHVGDTGNPHNVTKTQVGLGAVDNTADADKPVSGPQAAADAAVATAADTARRVTVSSRGPVVAGYYGAIFDLDGRLAFGVDAAGDANLGGVKWHIASAARDGSPFVWSVGDAGGGAAIAVDRAGRAWITDLVLLDAAPRHGSPFVWSVTDRDGRAAIGITPLGQLVAPEIAHSVTAGRGGAPYAWSIYDLDGHAALGVRGDGVTEIGRLVLDDYTPPGDWATDYEVANVRHYRGFDVALRIDGAYCYDVRRNPGSNTAVIQSAAPLIVALTYGQSNAGEGGNETDPAILTAVYPTSVFGFATGFSSYGTAAQSSARLRGLAALRQTTALQNDMPGPLTAFALEHGWRDAAGRASPGILSWTSWEGGQPITAFVRGTTNWNNLIAGAAASVAAAAEYGRSVQCPAIAFIQGESGPSTGYRAALEALADDLCPEVQTAMGLAAAPKLLIAQINSNDTATSASGTIAVRRDQLAAAQSHARIVLAGPMYQCPMVDDIHSTNEGRMVFAEMLAEAHRVLHQTGNWTPLWCTSAVRTGANIDLTFAVPYGDLRLDTDWVQAVANNGFAYSDSTSSATISSVTITGRDSVRVTLSATPTGASQKISYALFNDSTDDGWAAGRGLLYSESTTKSLFHRLGHAVPEFVRHYCVAFEMDLT